ncbi:hypothetical protein N9P15_07045 [Planktomarina sp.]|nr:hypothetical protein [Planktomarina sp.]
MGYPTCTNSLGYCRSHPAAKRLMRIYKGDMLAYEKDGKRVIGSVKQLSLQAGLILAPHTETNADSRNRNKADPFKFTYLGAGSLIKTKARRIHIDEIGRLRNSGPPA